MRRMRRTRMEMKIRKRKSVTQEKQEKKGFRVF